MAPLDDPRVRLLAQIAAPIAAAFITRLPDLAADDPAGEIAAAQVPRAAAAMAIAIVDEIVQQIGGREWPR